MVLLIIGGLFNRMAPALWVIAIVATLTVIHRILHTWQDTKAGRTLPRNPPLALGSDEGRGCPASHHPTRIDSH